MSKDDNCNKQSRRRRDPYGIKNVNFSIIERGDRRWIDLKNQRLERGFDDSELWNLDTTIAEFIVPRLERFKEIIVGYPSNLSEKKWNSILDDMIFAFKYVLGNYKINSNRTEEDYLRHKKGMKLFIKYYSNLWD